MSRIWMIARQDVRLFLRDWSALLWLFVMPPLFIFMIGNITAGFAGGEQRDRLAVQWMGERGVVEQWLARRLGEEFELRNFDVDQNRIAHEFGDFSAYQRRLVVAADVSERLLDGEAIELVFDGDSEAVVAQFDELRLRRAVYRTLADVLLASQAGKVSIEALEVVANAPAALRLSTEMAGGRRQTPSGFAQAVPGILVFFVLIMLLATGGSALVNERQRGQLRRLACAPMSRLGVVLGKGLGRLALAAIQIVFVMLAGWWLFDYSWQPNLAMVLLVVLAWAMVCAASALLLGSLVSTEGQAIAIGVIGGNLLGALGGCWWPIEITPLWMQSLQAWLPTGWTINALHDLITFGYPPASVWPELLALSALAMVLALAAARRFRFS
jgi:ABC-type multidrug transport system permease subunit